MSEPGPQAYAANIRKFYAFKFLAELQFWLPIWVIYLRDERGLSLTQITAMDAPFWLVLVLAEVPTGVVADRFGRKVSLTTGAAIHAFAILIFGVGETFPVLLGSYLLWGVAMTLYSGADAAFFFDSLKAVGRESEFQKLWGRVRSIHSGAAMVSIALGAPLAAATNLWFPVVLGSVFLAAAWLISLTFTEPPRLDEGEHEMGFVAGTKDAARIAFGTPALRYMILLAASVMAAGVAMSILSQPFLDAHGVDVANLGWFLLPGSIVGIFASMFAYRLTQTFGVRAVMAALPFIIIGAGTGLGLWDSLGAFIFLPLGSLVFSMSFPVISDYLNQRIPSARRATILSFHQLVFSLMLAGLEPSLGFIAHHQGLPIAYRTGALLLLAAAAPLLFLWLRADRGAAPPSEARPVRLAEAGAGGE